MKPLLPLVLLVLAAPASAFQVSRGGLPPSLVFPLPGDLEVLELPPVDVDDLLQEDALRAKNEPLRYGALVPVDLGPQNAGRWDTLPDGARVWRLAVSSPGALSMQLLFDRWLLPDGVEVHLRDAGAAATLGAFTSENNNVHAQFATQPLPGDLLVLEMLVPAWVERGVELHVETVVHAYRDVLGGQDDGGAAPDGSGSCNINVNCPLGDDWQDEKRSVAKLLLGGFLCSGALINNTAQDQRQFLLTANHCQAGNPAQWTFIFNNESATCGGSSGPSSDSVVGCVVRASSSGSDFALVEITEAIPQSYGVYYAGWDRSGANPTQGTGIHHPGGDIKKICRDEDLITEDSGGTWLWHVADWEQGVTEGGSSGSPLFDQNSRIVGQLCCGAAFCGFLFDDYYGQFDRTWGFGASPWLDPLGTGTVALDGLDGAVPPTPPDLVATSPAELPPLFAFQDETVTVSGTGLLSATDFLVGGAPLPFPYTWQVVGDQAIEFTMPPQPALGPVDLEVVTPGGSDTLSVQVVAPDAPVQRLGGGEVPEPLFSFLPVEFAVAGTPGTLVLVWGSPDLVPTTVPGVLDLAIGDGFASLVYVDAVTIPAKGWGETSFFLPPGVLPGGTTLWCQSFEYDPVTGALPVVASNVSEAWFLF